MIRMEHISHLEEVLIDTWWNVNLSASYYYEGGKYVLIDTWWNVNVKME